MKTELALRIRERGLRLSTHSNYEDERVRAIALRQEQLFDELDALDEELRALAVPVKT